jgi:hypothetical protein
MKLVITAQDVPAGGELRVPVGTIVTSSAPEVSAGRGVRILEVPEDQLTELAPPTAPSRSFERAAQPGREACRYRGLGARATRAAYEGSRITPISGTRVPNW